MSNPLLLKLARKIKFPVIRKWLLQPLFKKEGLRLQNIRSFNRDRYFIYRVGDTYIPNESLLGPISYESSLKKCRNESLFAYEPRTGDTIIDIGAGLGEEALFFSKLVGNTGHVYAIEANPAVFEVLRKTVSLNKLNNTEIFNLAINAENGQVQLANTTPSYESGFIQPVSDQPGAITALRMDAFLDRRCISRIDLLKVNIEGAERYVVETITPRQFRMIRQVAIACHDFRYREEGNPFFQTKEYVSRVLQDNGFVLQTRQTGTDYLDDWVYGTNKF